MHQLALNPDLYKRLQFDWVLFPDHAVFLGPKAIFYDSWAQFDLNEDLCNNLPELLFIKNSGVYVKPRFNNAKTAQLICYYDVISQIPPDQLLDPLDDLSVNALLNWDAEQYRLQIAK